MVIIQFFQINLDRVKNYFIIIIILLFGKDLQTKKKKIKVKIEKYLIYEGKQWKSKEIEIKTGPLQNGNHPILPN